MSYQQASPPARFRRERVKCFGASRRRFWPRFDAGGEPSNADTHVGSPEGRLSDAGSTPAASTTYLVLRQCVAVFTIGRLQNISKRMYGSGLVEQPDRTFDRRGTQMHVPLRCREIHVPGQILNRARWRAPHGEMRTERVPQSVHARFHIRPTRRPLHVILDIFCVRVKPSR